MTTHSHHVNPPHASTGPAPGFADAAEPAMRLGRYLTSCITARRTIISVESPLIRPYVSSGWFQDHLSTRIGERVVNDRAQPRPIAEATNTDIDCHTFVVGSTGMGKTRLMGIFVDHALRLGRSVVVTDPKGARRDQIIARARRLGQDPARTIIVSPRLAGGVPGFNPLNCGLPPEQAAQLVRDLVQRQAAVPGYRMWDLLSNAALICAAHQLSLVEIVELLLNDDFRDGLLRLPPVTGRSIAYDEACRFMAGEFARWPRSERLNAAGPVLNKLREWLRVPLLRGMLCARQQTLDLADLWRRQTIVLLDLDADQLGDSGCSLLAGMVTMLLFRTGIRSPGPVPVALFVDELGEVARMAGSSLGQVVTVAREAMLSLYLATQHLGQVPEELQSALLENAGVQVYLRCGHRSASILATALASRTRPFVSHVTVDAPKPDSTTGVLPRASAIQNIVDAQGCPINFDSGVWRWITATPLSPDSLLKAIEFHRRMTGRSALRVAVTGATDSMLLGHYLRTLAPGSWAITGPRPLQLLILFPRPLIREVRQFTTSDARTEWERVLNSLPIAHGVLRAGHSPVGVVQIDNVPDLPLGAPEAIFTRQALSANGQSTAQVRADYEYRIAQIERIASGGAPSVFPAVEDPSIE